MSVGSVRPMLSRGGWVGGPQVTEFDIENEEEAEDKHMAVVGL